jgi:hypothetical protein
MSETRSDFYFKSSLKAFRLDWLDRAEPSLLRPDESVVPYRAIPKLSNFHSERAVMTGNKYSVMKRVVLAAALLAGMSGVAGADDSSMSRLGGESYPNFDQPTNNASAD